MNEVESGDLTFTPKQIEYLRSEFDRQRRWINTLTERENSISAELDRLSNSISYRFGRFITWPLRKIQKKMMKKKPLSNNLEFEELGKEIIPYLVIDPELLPEGGTRGLPNVFIQETLLSLKNSNASMKVIKDRLDRDSYGFDDETLRNCLGIITEHLLSGREPRASIKNFFVASIRCLSKNNYLNAIEYFEEFSEHISDVRANRTIVQLHMNCGNISEPLKILKLMKRDEWSTDRRRRLKPQEILIKEGYSTKTSFKRNWTSKPNVVLYNVSQSLPHTTSGYAMRTHGLMKAISKSKYDITICSRHGYPLDRADFKGVYKSPIEQIDGLTYRFNPIKLNGSSSEINYSDVYNFIRFNEYQSISMDSLYRQAKEIQPSIIHAASNFVVGLAAISTAKALGIPSIYEIRGFWHITQASKKIGYEHSDHYNLSESMEFQVAELADHVFTITKGIADLLITNGIDSNKITILPNAVDINKFNPMARDIEIEDDLDLSGKLVIGYIGSFVEYEGLDLLLQAIARIRKEFKDSIRLLLVGDGEVMDDLRELSRFLGINDIVIFIGMVDHDEVDRYYSVIDIAVYPRKGTRVCELVSPLKPYEAMAMQKAVIASNVQALSEMVIHGQTGLLHEKDNIESLANCIKMLVNDDELRTRLSSQAREWVAENRTWDSVSKTVLETYNNLQTANQ